MLIGPLAPFGGLAVGWSVVVVVFLEIGIFVGWSRCGPVQCCLGIGTASVALPLLRAQRIRCYLCHLRELPCCYHGRKQGPFEGNVS